MTILSAITAYVDAVINTNDFATILEAYHSDRLRNAIAAAYPDRYLTNRVPVGCDYDKAREQKARLVAVLRELGAAAYGIDPAAEYHKGNDELSESGVMLRGNVVYSSWGYEQTNIDFYLVIRRTKTMVTLLPMQSAVAEQSGYMQGSKVPTAVKYEEQPIRRKVRSWNGKESCKDLHGHGSCDNWSGNALAYSSYH